MATQMESEHDVGVATLASGIIQDARDLFAEQIKLFKVEIQHRVHETVNAVIPLGIGVGIALSAPLLIGIAAAFFLSWMWPDLPLWGSFLIVGSAVGLAGGALIYWGKSALERVHLKPDTAIQGLKENLQWKTKN